jgi:hypothetical protein
MLPGLCRLAALSAIVALVAAPCLAQQQQDQNRNSTHTRVTGPPNYGPTPLANKSMLYGKDDGYPIGPGRMDWDASRRNLRRPLNYPPAPGYGQFYWYYDCPQYYYYPPVYLYQQPPTYIVDPVTGYYVAVANARQGLNYSQRQSDYYEEPVRERVIVRDAPSDREYRQNSRRPSTADADDYYLNQKPKPKTAVDKDPALADTVSDIELAFRRNDISKLEKHLDKAGQITLQAGGRNRQPLKTSDYLQMTSEAFKTMKTMKYDLTGVEPGSNGAWMVFGQHVIQTDNGNQVFNVGFVLKKSGDHYVIAEVTADPAK